jgi:hypothetical protein
VPAGALERQQGALKTIRGQLNDALEQQVPGYAEANAQSAALARRAEAVQVGTGILDSGKTAPSPGRFAGGAMVPGEQGARAEVDRQLGTKVNDLVALKGALQGEGGWNTAKIGTAFGDDAANALVASVDRNTKFRDTFNKVVENSQTSQRSQAAKALEDGSPSS